jgi:hypothetical protein
VRTDQQHSFCSCFLLWLHLLGKPGHCGRWCSCILLLDQVRTGQQYSLCSCFLLWRHQEVRPSQEGRLCLYKGLLDQVRNGLLCSLCKSCVCLRHQKEKPSQEGRLCSCIAQPQLEQIGQQDRLHMGCCCLLRTGLLCILSKLHCQHLR